MRSKTSKTFAWIIVLILVIGLAGFGIQDVLRSSGRNEVASFGNQKITSDDYVRMIQQETRNLSQQFGTNLSFDQAQSLGVTQMALQKLISSAILDQALEDLGISQSDATLENAIKDNSAFLDIAGRFSTEKYKEVLLNINLQPSEYENILRRELSRELLVKITNTKISVDHELKNLITGYFLEERIANVLVLKQNISNAGSITITDAEAQLFYDNSTDLFTQPETKKISYVYLSPNDILDDQNVSQEEIQQAYELAKETLNTPEKRNIDQIFFDTEEAATTAMKVKNTKARSFENVVELRGLNKDDVTIGNIAKADLPSNVQNELFSSAKNSISGPFKTDLGYAMYRINDITPANVTTLAAESEAIKRQVGLIKANKELSKLLSFVNDEVAGGLTLEEIGDSTKMTFGKLDIFPGASLPELASSPTFKSMVRSAKNYASDVELDENGGLVSLRIDSTVQPFLKDFNSVKEIAKENALSKKITDNLEKRAKFLLNNRLTNASSIFAVAKEEQSELIKNKSYTRFDREQRLPPSFTELLYSLSEKDFDIIKGDEEIFIVHLDKIVPGLVESEDGILLKDQIQAQFVNSLQQDIFSALIDGLKDNHDLFISQKAVDAVLNRFN